MIFYLLLVLALTPLLESVGSPIIAFFAVIPYFDLYGHYSMLWAGLWQEGKGDSAVQCSAYV